MSISILRASAGSGKTYALTLNYLQLLLAQDSPGYFRSILAVTFTNKATQEMKARIMKELEKIATGETDNGMGKALVESIGITADELQQRAKNALVNILHNYSHFSVSTIDSFFQKVVRSFAREAELPATYSIELNTAKVLEELTDKLMAKAEKDKHLMELLYQFSSEQLSLGKSWNIRKNLHKLISEVVKEGFMQQEKGLKQLNKNPELAKSFIQKLKKIKKDFENEMEQIGISALQAIEQAGLSVADFRGGKTGVANHFNKILPKRKEYCPTKTVRQVRDQQQTWYTGNIDKDKTGKIAIIANFAATHLDNYLDQAIKLSDKKSYNSACIVLEHFTTCALLGEYMQLLEEYRKENNVLLISDVASLLQRIIGEDDAPFVYEKAGNRYNHFLIDEFQDTSRQHWGNFMPLLLNSIGYGNDNLIVGDPKQSIYRWRGGDLRLMLNEVENQLPGASTDQLTNNWRSCEEVIRFNNCLFQHAAAVVTEEAVKSKEDIELPKQQEAIIQELLDNIEGVYENSAQAFPKEKKIDGAKCGFVQVQLVKGGDLSFYEQAKTLMISNIKQICEKGYELQDIALLVRNNSHARQIASYLADNGYDVLSEEALRLNSANTVQLLVSLMQFLHNIKNKPAIVTAVKLYAAVRNAESPDAASLAKCASDNIRSMEGLLPDEFLAEHISLSRMALYDMCSRLSRIFGLDTLRNEEHYLEAFLNEVHCFCHEEAGDIGSFLEWWQEDGVKQNLKRDQAPNAIRILTVHKSKGLQYPVVLIPFCNWSLDLDPKNTNIIWANTKLEHNDADLKDFFDGLPLVGVPVKYGKHLAESYFRFDYLQEKFQAYLDNLNLLYVALTRAEDALLITAEQSDATSRHAGWIVQKCLDEMGAEKEELSSMVGEIQFDYKQAVYGELHQNEQSTETAPQADHSYHTPLQNWDKILQLRKHAKPVYIENNEQIANSIDYGTLVHDVLAKVNYQDALPDVLERMQLQSEITKRDAEILKEKMDILLNIPQVASWFSREWQVKNEQPILGVGGDVHRPDRILVQGRQAVVIDYKTGERSSSHHRQLRRYMRQLELMGYTAEGYILYIEEENPIVPVLQELHPA